MAQMASVVVMPPIVEYLPDLSKHHIVGLFCFYAVTQCASRYVLPVFTKSNNDDSGSSRPAAPFIHCGGGRPDSVSLHSGNRLPACTGSAPGG